MNSTCIQRLVGSWSRARAVAGHTLVSGSHADLWTTQRRCMGGGKRFTLHSRNLPPGYKHKLILRYCDQMFGCKAIEHKQINRPFRPQSWVRIESLLYHDIFKGWTKVKHFLNAFDKSKGRYKVDTKANLMRSAALRDSEGSESPHGTKDQKETPKKKLTKPSDYIHLQSAIAGRSRQKQKKALTDEEILFIRLDEKKLDPEKHIIPRVPRKQRPHGRDMTPQQMQQAGYTVRPKAKPPKKRNATLEYPHRRPSFQP